MKKRSCVLLTAIYFCLGAMAGFLLAQLYTGQRGCSFASLSEHELMAQVERVAKIYQAQQSMEVARCLLSGLDDDAIAAMANQLAQTKLQSGEIGPAESLMALAAGFGSSELDSLANLAQITVSAKQPVSASGTPGSSELLFAVVRSQSMCASPGGVVSVAVYGPAGEELPGQRVCLLAADGSVRDCSVTGLKDPRSPGMADLVLHSQDEHSVVLLNSSNSAISPVVKLPPLIKSCPEGQAVSFTVEYVAISNSPER